MAKQTISGFESVENQMKKLSRGIAKRLVEAGADALVKSTEESVEKYHHVGKTGSMKENIRAGEYHETLGGGWQEVYPQGTDPRGVSNALKAFVINYGYGGKKTAKTGDKFITGNKKKRQSAVAAAMEKENQKIINEANGGT